MHPVFICATSINFNVCRSFFFHQARITHMIHQHTLYANELVVPHLCLSASLHPLRVKFSLLDACSRLWGEGERGEGKTVTMTRSSMHSYKVRFPCVSRQMAICSCALARHVPRFRIPKDAFSRITRREVCMLFKAVPQQSLTHPKSFKRPSLWAMQMDR